MKKFCIIGHNIGYAKSPLMHQAAMDELEIEGEFDRIDISPEALPAFMSVFKENYAGAAVTKPYKQAVLPYLDAVAPAVQEIGACNTLVVKDCVLTGTNTDAYGALVALRSVINPIDKKVLVLGAGGAAKAIVFMLQKANVKSIALWNRTAQKAQKMIEENAEVFHIDHVQNLKNIDPEAYEIVINTTSVGTDSTQSVLPASFWRPSHTAMDIVYSPLETTFLRDANIAGANTVTGDVMLVHQAVAQFKLWHDQEIEPEVLESAFFDA